MKQLLQKKRILKVFLLGAGINILLFFCLSFLDQFIHFSRTFNIIFSAPARPFIAIGDKILWWYCIPRGLCYGLSFDGGPLAWMELTYSLVSFPLSYGILAVLVDTVWQILKQKKQKSKNNIAPINIE